MPEVKPLLAKKVLKLDCGCVVREQDFFMVTRVFTCMKVTGELLKFLMKAHQTHQPQPEKLASK
jgi:hypothetical protein